LDYCHLKERELKNVAITGVSGYLGTLLAKRISQETEVERVIGLDVKEPAFNSPKFTFIKHDVRQPFTHIFAGNKVDTALHLAFIVVPARDEQRARQINLEGSKNFLEAAAGTEQIYYMGSHTEYGARDNNTGAFTEDAPLNPNPDYPYPCDKAKVDLMFQDFAKAHPETCVTIGRTVAVTGQCGEACGLTTLFLPVMVKAAGKNPLWQFIHEEDLVELIVLLLKNRKAGIYNLAGAGGVTYSDMIKQLKKPSISLPSWLLHASVNISWKLRLQSKGQSGALALLEHPIKVSSEKVLKATGYRMRYTGEAAWEEFIKAMGNQ
jgi:UDP-glucose 4-epimerase